MKKQILALNLRYMTVCIAVCILAMTWVEKAEAQGRGAYTLYSVQNSTKAYLVDTTGATYHTWNLTGKTGYSTYLESGGTLVRTIAHNGNSLNGAAMCGEVQKVDWDGNITWDFVYSSSTYCTHHDICPLPNGNVLLISYDVRTAAEASAAGCSKSMIIWAEKIVEVKPTGATTGDIVWEWHVWDHLCQAVSAQKNNYVTSVSDHPELLNINYSTQQDWMHMNGISYNALTDQICFSSHNLNEMYIIDHSTTTAEAATHSGGNSGKGGDFLYRWGNPAAYGMTGTKILNVVHDAHFVAQDCPYAGYLVGFNNGGTSSKSTIDMVQLPANGYLYDRTAGAAFGPATYTKRVTCISKTSDMGSSQMLPNGNMLICMAQSGTIYEINSAGTTVWTKSAGGTVPKAFRYTADYVNGSTSSITASAGAEKLAVCPGESVTLSVTASGASAYSYSWTSNPSGYTSSQQNPVVTPTVTTTYTVKVTSGTKSTTSLVTITVYPVPDKPVITLTGDTLTASSASTYVWYLDGTEIQNVNTKIYLPTASGSYTVKVKNSNGCESELSDPVDFVVSSYNISVTASAVSICAGDSVSLNAEAQGAANFTYSWSSVPSGYFSDKKSPVVKPDSTTVYSVTAVSGTKSLNGTVKIVVNPLPDKPSVYINGNVLSTDMYSGYQWYLNGVLLESAYDREIIPSVNGLYSVKVKNAFDCLSPLSDAIDFVMTDVAEDASDIRFEASPNPTSGIVRFGSEIIARVYNSEGRPVYHFTGSSVDLGFLPDGIYLISYDKDVNSFGTIKISLVK